MKNIFLEKSYTKCVVETIPGLFSKKSRLSISLDQKSKVLHILYFLVCDVEDYWNIFLLLHSINLVFTSPKYLFNIIPVTVSRYNTRNTNNIPQFKVKHNFFRNSFFPSAVIEWNKLDLNIRNSESLNVFKNSLLKFIRPPGNSVFSCHNLRGVKLLTRLRLGLSHLREHKFKHGFQDSLNPIRSCGNDNETSAHCLLPCPHLSNERSTFLKTIRNINRNIFDKKWFANYWNLSLWWKFFRR